MASHGKVLDLFNDRDLHLQDVYGNVEPMCTLVSYQEYKRPIIVYRLDRELETFVALLQDLTERKARQTGKEIWTWCVQWEIGSVMTQQPLASPHSTKKPRLNSEQPNPSTTQPSRAPITVQPCVIPQDLLERDEMQRILVDIVQVSSAVLPNFIEFMYRWVDCYLGDGKALKAALFGEIPSLWDFERHPRMIPGDIKERIKQSNSDTDDMSFTYAIAEEITQNSPTKKMREMPDLAAFERKAEESERLQYREVRFGILPSKADDPLPPLINIPQNDDERLKYYAACYKSRQRAFYMLTDLGVTTQNMKDYIRGQKEKVKDTPFRNGDGLMNYARDGRMAQHVFLDNEAHLRKPNEIAISNKLAQEAQTVDHRVMAEPSGVPLIPPTPLHPPRRDVATEILRKARDAKTIDDDRIQFVPVPLVGQMDSEIFKDALDRETLMKKLMSQCKIPQRLGAKVPRHELPRVSPLPPLPRTGSQPNLLQALSNSLGMLMSRPPTPYVGPPPSAPGSSAMPPPDFAVMPRPLHVPPSRQSQDSPPRPPPGFPGMSLPGGPLSGISSSRPPLSFPPVPPVSPRDFRVMPPMPPMPRRDFLAMPPSGGPPPGLPSGFPAMLPPPRSVPPRLPPDFPLRFPSLGAEQLLLPPEVPPQHLPQNLSPMRPLGFAHQPPAAQQASSAYGSNSHMNSTMQNEGRHTLPLPSFSLPPRPPSMQRNAPAPLNLQPQASPFSTLAACMLATSPFAPSHSGYPVQIYFPRVVMPANIMGPGGEKLGDGGCAETDAFLLGHVFPGSGEIQLTRAVFLPMGVWRPTQNKVRKDRTLLLETYVAQSDRMSNGNSGVAHRAAWEKLKQAYDFMIPRPAAVRENELTKRWRVSKGPMTATQRGAVWEAWGVVIDKEIKMRKEERPDVMSFQPIIDGPDQAYIEKEARRMELEALMEEEEEEMGDSDEDDTEMDWY